MCRVVLGSLLVGTLALAGPDRVAATDLALPASSSAAGAFLSASQTYHFVTGSEERHFSYRIPSSLVNRPAGSVPVVVLLHGGLPSGAGDAQFLQDFLGGLDETRWPYNRYAYISVRAARIPATRCRDLHAAQRIDDAGLAVCLVNAAGNRHGWRFAGASASTAPDPDLPDAWTVDDPESYVDVLALEAILRDFADTFPSLDVERVFVATFSYGSHVADQLLCTRSTKVRAVASITGSWLTRSQFGADGALGGPDGSTECGSGHEPGYLTLAGRQSDAYGRRGASGEPLAGGQLANRVPVFRSIGRADHNLAEGMTAPVAGATMAWLNGVSTTYRRVDVLRDIDASDDDGKALTLAQYRTPVAGETWFSSRLLVIGQCGLSTAGGAPAFDPRDVPAIEGAGCTHGIWGSDVNVGNDRQWPTLAMQFFLVH